MQEESEYGDFEEIVDESQKKEQPEHDQQQNIRVRLPRQGQVIGIVVERLGGKRMSVKSTDNKIRNCRVPGRFSRKFWLRPGNAVIIQPWPDDDGKADVVHQYSPNEVGQLRRKGFLNNIENRF